VADLQLGEVDTDIFTTHVGASSGSVSQPIDDGEMPGQAPSRISIPLSKMLLFGDCVSILEQFAPESVDHVITDWPYAIDMDTLAQSGSGMTNIDSTRAEHNVMENEALHRVIVPLIHRVLKPNGFFITFLDYMTWQSTYDHAIKAGFKVQRWPGLWYKTGRFLDPFAGRGSSTIAALNYGINPIAIETNPHHHAALVVNVSDWYTKTLRSVDFV
jgi:DNA modification methylase